MKRSVLILLCLCWVYLQIVALRGAAAAGDGDTQWPQWRGPEATGVARHADPPVNWDENTNLKWKIEVPGEGHASPIVWNDRIYVLTAVQTDKAPDSAVPATPAEPGRSGGRGLPMRTPTNVNKFDVLAVNREDGSIAWRRTVCEELPHARTHGDGSWASGSPTTDGERLYAPFGSRGLYCLDMAGQPLWEKNFGNMEIRMQFGEGSSPALYGDALVVNWDHEGDSFIVALNKKTGEELWRVAREERTSWATPAIFEAGGKPQVVASATTRIRSYDLASGALIWECGGMTENVIPSPVVGGGALYAMSGFRGSALRCIDLSRAQGDVTDSQAVLWSLGQDTPYVPSPLLYDDALYFLKGSSEALSCVDAKTGKAHYATQKLEGLQGVYSSPVGAAGRVYITGRNGVTVVIERGPEYKVLAANALDDRFTASAALVGKQIFLRGHKALYCIGG